MKSFFLVIEFLIAGCNIITGQNYTEILGRPTNSSITVSILFDQQADVFWEYGTVPGSYPFSTDTLVADKEIPLEVDFINLLADTKYYYKTKYRLSGTSTPFSAGAEHSFQTQRISGGTFTFAVEADPHLDSNSNTSAYSLTLQNILSAKPDFLLDLGDNFFSEKLPVINQTEITNRHLLYRPYFGSACHSVPLFIALGNHEGESGWRNDGTENCLAVMASNTRKLYYPNPVPNSFYSGNTKEENWVGLRENYYAWEWGNALFIVLDPYWNTVNRPDWGWTLGETQYNWFKNTITESKAKFKFIFAHQLVGGDGTNARGGTEFAHLFEMGGYNADSTWGFDTYRPGWGKPIHTLMVENKATVFFHGHDHFFGKQDKDDIVYQEVPQPSSRNINNMPAGSYGYVNGDFLPSRGYILVTVTDSTVKADYIRTYLPNEESGDHTNGEVAYSYTIHSYPAGIEERSMAAEPCRLEQNFPNPFNSETTIKYRLLSANDVRLKISDIFGREKATLVSMYQQPGEYSVSLNSENLSLIDGIYFCTLSVGTVSQTKKMVLICE